MHRVDEGRNRGRARSNCARLTLAAIAWISLALAGVPTSATGAQQTHTEDFTTTTYRDSLNTTAFWDTTVAELKLHRFVLSLAGSYETPGGAVGVAVSGDLAFVADGDAGLQVIDISDPSNPVLAGSRDTPGYAHSVVAAGDHAFVTDFGSGLQVIDITDPANPVLAGSYDTPGYAHGVAVAGDHAFVADQSAGLQVIDITDPTNPVLAGSRDTPGDAFGVAVAGDHAFVADGDAGLQVIDISDPTNPVLAGSLDTPDVALGVAVSGDHAFVADYHADLQVIDISDPANPVPAGSLDTPGYARRAAVAGDHAFVADHHNGLQVIDISDPTNPALAGSYETPGFAYGVAVAGDHAFVADINAGLQVIEISRPTISFTGSLDTPDQARDVAVAGDHAFVADDDAGLQVIDITDPTNPALAGSYGTPGRARGLVVAGDHAFVADGEGLQVIDISDPTNPVLLGSYEPVNPFYWDVAISGDHAFVVDPTYGLLVVDISDPTNPYSIFLAGSQTPGSAYGVAVAGDYAFVADGDAGLQVIDISDPTDTWITGSYDTPDVAFDVAVSGDHAFVADGDAGLLVIDVSDPTSPVLAGSLDTPSFAGGVAVSGDQAFVTDSDAGLLMIDISDPTNPALARSLDTPDIATKVAVSGYHAFVADSESGLQVIQVYQSEVAMEPGVGQSLEVDGGTLTIPRARLMATESAGVSWELSADGESNWSPIAADATWTRIAVQGDDLRWRSTHTWSPGTNPTVSELTLDWMYEFGPISLISDVPDDQGGRVDLSFTRSGYDFTDETELPVVGYAIYRRVDDTDRERQVFEEGIAPGPENGARIPLAAYGTARVRILGDQTFVLGVPGGKRGEFPPGVWEGVGWVLPTQSDEYVVRVHTAADSTVVGGMHWSVYLTAVHTSIPSVWFASPPDSGYSVDNIPPSIPTNLIFDEPMVLRWDPASEPDFEHHSVYGSESAIFDETASLIGYTVDPTYDVSGTPFGYYHVTTSDRAGNESEAASIESETVSTPVGTSLPTAFALHAAGPNPFQWDTVIGFDLPEPRHVRLAIFDASGRMVGEAVNTAYPAGRHRITWGGINQTGRALVPGVYFARIKAGGWVSSLRLVVLR